MRLHVHFPQHDGARERDGEVHPPLVGVEVVAEGGRAGAPVRRRRADQHLRRARLGTARRHSACNRTQNDVMCTYSPSQSLTVATKVEGEA